MSDETGGISAPVTADVSADVDWIDELVDWQLAKQHIR